MKSLICYLPSCNDCRLCRSLLVHSKNREPIVFHDTKCIISRDHPEYGISQWKTMLHCIAISHWLSPYLKWISRQCMILMSKSLMYNISNQGGYCITFRLSFIANRNGLSLSCNALKALLLCAAYITCVCCHFQKLYTHSKHKSI